MATTGFNHRGEQSPPPAPINGPPPGLLSNMVNQAVPEARQSTDPYGFMGLALDYMAHGIPTPQWPAQAKTALNPQTLGLQGRPVPTLGR